MVITINWATKVITVQMEAGELIDTDPFDVYQLNIDTFRLALKDLEDDVEGMPFLTTHNHNTVVTVGGVTLARVVEIINGYTVTFVNGSYAVNLIGANSNISDVLNLNSVQVRAANSAGLTELNLENVIWNALTTAHTTTGTTGEALSNAGAAGNPWATLVSGNTTAGTFGELVGRKLLTIAKFLGLK